MAKKASANMWWIIIGAVIALVVMIILMVMFTGKTSKLEGGLLDCESKGGDCSGDVAACNQKGGTVSWAFDCKDGENVCCFTSKKNSGQECTTNSECSSNLCSIKAPLTEKTCE